MAFGKNAFLAPFSDKLNIKVAGGSCAILAIRPEAPHPQLISTSRHVTQGIIDVTNEAWDAATKTLSGVSAVMANDPYELRITMPASGEWRVMGVEGAAEEVQAGVKITMSTDGTNLRVRLNNPIRRSLRWNVRFAAK